MMFAACSKKSDLSVPKTADSTSQKILNFKAKIETGNKSYETMSVDSAVWYVEAALNFTYCMAESQEDYQGAELISDSLKIDFPATGNSPVLFSDVAAAYNNMKNGFDTYSANLNFPWKKFYVADVYFKKQQLVCKFSVAVKESTGHGKVNINDVYLDWHTGAASQMGRCDYTRMTESMATVFTSLLTWKHSGRPANGYYTDIEVRQAWCNDSQNPDAMLFSGDFPPNTSPCISGMDVYNWYIWANMLDNTYTPPAGWAKVSCLYSTLLSTNFIHQWASLWIYTGKINIYVIPTE
jgi:hypothetical protein